MFESLTDEGYIPCVSLLDFQKTGGKLILIVKSAHFYLRDREMVLAIIEKVH